jgi:hypothetical protein
MSGRLASSPTRNRYIGVNRRPSVVSERSESNHRRLSRIPFAPFAYFAVRTQKKNQRRSDLDQRHQRRKACSPYRNSRPTRLTAHRSPLPSTYPVKPSPPLHPYVKSGRNEKVTMLRRGNGSQGFPDTGNLGARSSQERLEKEESGAHPRRIEGVTRGIRKPDRHDPSGTDEPGITCAAF